LQLLLLQQLPPPLLLLLKLHMLASCCIRCAAYAIGPIPHVRQHVCERQIVWLKKMLGLCTMLSAFQMRVVGCCLLLALVACAGLRAAAQPPVSPGTLSIGQVFSGQYDDFTTFGSDLVFKISSPGGSVSRLNGLALTIFPSYFSKIDFSKPVEGQSRRPFRCARLVS